MYSHQSYTQVVLIHNTNCTPSSKHPVLDVDTNPPHLHSPLLRLPSTFLPLYNHPRSNSLTSVPSDPAISQKKIVNPLLCTRQYNSLRVGAFPFPSVHSSAPSPPHPHPTYPLNLSRRFYPLITRPPFSLHQLVTFARQIKTPTPPLSPSSLTFCLPPPSRPPFHHAFERQWDVFFSTPHFIKICISSSTRSLVLIKYLSNPVEKKGEWWEQDRMPRC